VDASASCGRCKSGGVAESKDQETGFRRECYSFDLMVTFHVNRLENEEEEKDPQDRAQLAKAWGNKRWALDAFLRTMDGDHALGFF
jgi:hypothetical protein